jgi:Ion channel
MKLHVASFWSSDHSLTVLLWVLGLSAFAVAPTLAVVSEREWEVLLLALIYTALIVSAVWSAWKDHTARGWLIVAASAPVMLLWIELVWHPPIVTFVNAGFRLGVVAAFGAVLLGRVLAPGPVTKARIKGALAAYLLIGVMFGELFRVLAIAWPNALSTSAAHPLGSKFTAEIMYFSFSTLTTAGYGDIVPVHPYARALANVEAITGQMYIVLLIGRLLTLHMSQSEQPQSGKR